jgi:hypothetical protein
MIVEMMLLGTAATVATQPRVSFPTEGGVATSCAFETSTQLASVSPVCFVLTDDVIGPGDFWESPVTNAQALAFGQLLMRDGTSNWVEID